MITRVVEIKLAAITLATSITVITVATAIAAIAKEIKAAILTNRVIRGVIWEHNLLEVNATGTFSNLNFS